MEINAVVFAVSRIRRMASEHYYCVKILYFSLVCLESVLGATVPGDYAVLDKFRKGLSNAELLEWPTDNQDPCGTPKWPHVFCSGPRVTQIQVQNMGLRGSLPDDLNKLTMLNNMGLQRNQFSGKLPSFKGLSNLQYAYLSGNQFDTIPADFFVGLDKLEVLSLDHNPLNDSGWILPQDLRNSAQLRNLTLMDCHLTGPLPDFLGQMDSLTVLKLSYNDLSGEIPASYSRLPLQIMWLNNQKGTRLSGSLDAIASMTMLHDVWLHGNQFSGRIPSSIGTLVSLQRMWLSDNRLVGVVPDNLIGLPSLQDLRLNNNLFVGPIPNARFSNFSYAGNSFCQPAPGVPCAPQVAILLDFLEGVGYNTRLSESWKGNNPCGWLGISCSDDNKVSVIDLPKYNLTGVLSPSLAKLDSLISVLLGNNSITGAIPSEMATMKSLKTLDLSYNLILNPVPKFPESVQLILEGNSLLSGSNGSPESSYQFDLVNGLHPPEGPSSSSGIGTNLGSTPNNKNIVIGLVTCGLVTLLVAVVAVLFFHYCRQKRKKKGSAATKSVVVHPIDSSGPKNLVQTDIASTDSNYMTSTGQSSCSHIGTGDTHMAEGPNSSIPIQVLRNATGNFASENALGKGGFGVVYKGEMDGGTKIAVKRMEGSVPSAKALDEFRAEIEIISKCRHCNLVSVLGHCVEDNERLLVYEYMPRGALSNHLFQWKQLDLEPLSWRKRLNIALDVARGMDYLHNLGRQRFIHRDLKPSNVLLDNDYRARISDFGLARLAPQDTASFATQLAGTFGYLAPEYAATGKVTTKIDVYSFGVVLMELVTGLKSLDENRSEESRYLVTWFCQMRTIEEKLRSIIDPSLDLTDDNFRSISIVAELAGHCTAREPHRRPGMSHAVNVLAPMVDEWKPMSGRAGEVSGTDFCKPLLLVVEGWKSGADDGTTTVASSSSTDVDDTSRPAG